MHSMMLQLVRLYTARSDCLYDLKPVLHSAPVAYVMAADCAPSSPLKLFACTLGAIISFFFSSL